jgi:ribose-phosphate pyrophosphokinase
MRVINLDQDFKPYESLGELFVKKFTFPSGIEPHINVDGLDIKGIYKKQDVIITHRIKSMTDVFEILLTVDALRRNYENEIGGMNLFIPYFPFSRQDRECTKGDPFSLEVFLKILSICNFDSIVTLDLHSEVLYNRPSKKDLKEMFLEVLYNRTSEEDFKKMFLENIPLPKNKIDSIFNNLNLFRFTGHNFNGINENYLIISPDEGSRSRCELFAQCEKEVVCFSKVRDPKTGKLLSFECETKDFEGKDCVIVDDICSKGGTFMGVAKILKERNAGKVILVVSHYEGIADEQALKDSGINKVYKTNSMNDYESDFVKNIKIKLIRQ